MSFIQYIHSLRAKPDHERERIIVASAVVGTLLIFGVWLINFHLADSGDPVTTDTAPGPISVFMGNAKAVFGNAWAQISQSKK